MNLNPFKRLIPTWVRRRLRPLKYHNALKAIGLSEIDPGKEIPFLGTDYGGHAAMLPILNEKSLCWCIGAGEDISFEIELAKIVRCGVEVFDPTPRSVKYVTERIRPLEKAVRNKIRLHEVGVWSEDTRMRFYAPANEEHVSHSLVNLQKTSKFIEVEVRTVATLMRQLGASELDLLKLNVEGAEYEIISSMFRSKIFPRQILIVFDELITKMDSDANIRLKDLVSSFFCAGYKAVYCENERATFLKSLP